jgi:hypothetical protein
VWASAVRQESLVLCRWESLGPEGRHAALVLEDLLNQQESRTNAEKDFVAAEVEYMLSLIALQQSMGTLLTADSGESLSSELLGDGAFQRCCSTRFGSTRKTYRCPSDSIAECTACP